jgi:hypothetical protein
MAHRRERKEWSVQDTESFFEAMEQFGTDFTTIAVLFPGLSREDIVAKYKLELRKRPERVRETLSPTNQRPIDVERFKKRWEECEKLKKEPARKLDDAEEAALRDLAGNDAGKDDAGPEDSAAVAGGMVSSGGHSRKRTREHVGPLPAVPQVVAREGEDTSEFQFDDDDISFVDRAVRQRGDRSNKMARPRLAQVEGESAPQTSTTQKAEMLRNQKEDTAHLGDTDGRHSQLDPIDTAFDEFIETVPAARAESHSHSSIPIHVVANQRPQDEEEDYFVFDSNPIESRQEPMDDVFW